MKLHELETKIGTMTFEKVKIEWPIEYIFGTAMFKINRFHEAQISPRGAAYMNTRIRNSGKTSKGIHAHYSYKSFVHFAKNEMWEALAGHINSAYDKLTELGFKKKLYALVVDGVVQGIVTDNYDFLPHQDVIAQIKENALTTAVHNCRIGEEKMEILLATKGHNEQGMSLYIRVINGHAGYDALSYKVIATNDNYIFQLPDSLFSQVDENKEVQTIAQKNRHLSQIEETFSNLVLLFEKVGQFTVNEKLFLVSAASVINLINTLVPDKTKRQIEIMAFVESQKRFGILKTGYDVVNTITKFGLTSGYGTSVSGLMDVFFKRFVEINFI